MMKLFCPYVQFSLVLSVAVGGTGGYFPDVVSNPTKPWLNSSPTAKLDFWNGVTT